LKGNGQALEQKYCFYAVLCDKYDPSANLLNQLNSHLVPCPGSFNGNWEEEVSTRKIKPHCRLITMPASHSSVFLQAGCSSCCPTNSVKALKATPPTPSQKKNIIIIIIN